jgi:hypothetical protein
MNTMYDYGDIICSAIDGDAGQYRCRVQVNGLKLSPRQAEPHIYFSAQSFASATEALHHGIDYINQNFPAGGPPFKVSGNA